MEKKKICWYLLFFVFFSVEKSVGKAIDINIDTTFDKNLKNINSTAQEIRPFISTDGKNLFFTRKNHPNNVGEHNRGDIWIATMQNDGSVGLPTNIGYPVNTENDEELMGINLNGTALYFTRNNRLWESKQKGRIWEEPIEIIFDTANIFTRKYNFFVSIDENYLLFSADDPNTLQKDIFVSIKNANGGWTPPVTLGAQINSKYENELGIFLTADTKTLFFSSDRKNGKGGYDWYKSNRLDETWQQWSPPKWCGDTINSSSDDLYMSLSFDEKNVFFSHQNSQRNIDIFNQKVNFPNQNKVILVSGSIKVIGNKNLNEKPILVYESMTTNEQKGFIQVDNEGDFSVLLPARINAFGIYAKQKNYFSTLSEVNFGEQNLEMLDGNLPIRISKKDSLKRIRNEQLLMRAHQLNTFISKYEGEAMDKIDDYRVQNYLPTTTPRVEDEKLIKIKESFNDPSTKNNDKEAKKRKEILKDDESLALQENNNASVTRAMYERYKQETYVADKPILKATPQKNDFQQDRAAIDDVLSLEGITKSYDTNNFKDLSEKVSSQIVSDIKNEVQIDLYNEMIEAWKGWKNLAADTEEAIFFEQKNQDIKRKYGKRVEQFFIKKSTTDTPKNKMEQDLYDAMLTDIRNSLVIAQRPLIDAEVDKNLSYLFAVELRTKIQDRLEKNLIKQMNTEAKYKVNNTEKKSGLSTAKITMPEQKIEIYPIENGMVIPLNGIYFYANSAEILPISEVEIGRIVQFLEDNPDIKIEIAAHTNSFVNNNFAQNLTQLRSSVIKNMLVAKGINKNRIFAIEQGRMNPLILNTNINARLKNQRIEMKILK
jgi:outer membrane protein OmpA-like peptidoglycan-associated protein